MTQRTGNGEPSAAPEPGALPSAVSLDALGAAALSPAGAHRLGELLALVAEGARRTLGASSLTISWRGERQAAPEVLASARGNARSADHEVEGVYLLTAEFACRRPRDPKG